MSNTAEVVLRNVRKVMSAGGRRDEVKPGALLKEGLGITSLQMVALLTHACGELGVDVLGLSDVDIVRMRSVQDVIDVLSERRCAAGG